jgi:hypothetical protein
MSDGLASIERFRSVSQTRRSGIGIISSILRRAPVPEPAAWRRDARMNRSDSRSVVARPRFQARCVAFRTDCPPVSRLPNIGVTAVLAYRTPKLGVRPLDARTFSSMVKDGVCYANECYSRSKKRHAGCFEVSSYAAPGSCRRLNHAAYVPFSHCIPRERFGSGV